MEDFFVKILISFPFYQQKRNNIKIITKSFAQVKKWATILVFVYLICCKVFFILMIYQSLVLSHLILSLYLI